MINYEVALTHQSENLSFDCSLKKLSNLVNRALDEMNINRRAIELGGLPSCSVSYPFDKWFGLYRSIGYTLKHIKKLNMIGVSEMVWRGHMSQEVELKYAELDNVQLDEHDIWHQNNYFEKICGFSFEYLLKAKKVFDKKCSDINKLCDP